MANSNIQGDVDRLIRTLESTQSFRLMADPYRSHILAETKALSQMILGHQVMPVGFNLSTLILYFEQDPSSAFIRFCELLGNIRTLLAASGKIVSTERYQGRVRHCRAYWHNVHN